MAPKGGNSKKDKAVAQCNADAGLIAEFKQSRVSGEAFDCAQSDVPEPVDQIAAYLSTIQRAELTQPFGCMLAVEESTFRIVGYSENCFELLGLGSVSGFEKECGRCLIGVDARGLFTPPSGVLLAEAVASREISLLNPVWVYSRGIQRPFYAILHRIDVGVVIDLEPARSGDPAVSLAGAVQLQKLAVRAISRLQAVPGGDIGALCDTLVEDVQKLTGYDRVMVYKFHEDDHGEVISEIRRSDLEPYLGLHYPATDIPQAARFLFKQNCVRIICDCNAKPVRVIQSENLKQPLCLVNSTLRWPHACHTRYMLNMGSIASLVMAVIVKGNDSSDLWGLVVCHNTSPRYVAFPLRYACQFLLQAFALQVQKELQLASQMAEKKILRTQALLCDMLLRDVPLGIVTQSPSIIDLVKCDGAAMCYGDRCWRLGITPTESQVKELLEWMIANHGDSTGLSTNSLADIGYPGAASLGDAVCGMATARITPNCMLFWFRSHAAKEVKWGGAKHCPEDKDDGGRMYPRSSFGAFLEVAKCRSSPWEVSEINAIHSLQLILRDSIMDMEVRSSKALTCGARQVDVEIQGMDEIGSAACEMVRLIETAIVPIFRVDSTGRIHGWNAKIAELTGLAADEAMGKSLGNEVVHPDSRHAFETLLCRALQGEEDRNVEIKFRVSSQSRQTSNLYIRVNACTSRDHSNDIVGVCFVGQDITSEKAIMDKFIRLQGDYEAIIQSLSPSVPAIFVSDSNACCVEWNPAMEKLTGWMRHEVIGRTLPGDVFGCLCRLKSQEDLTKFTILLYQAITERNAEQFTFGFFDKKGIFVDVLLTLSKRTDANGEAFGCFCFLLVVSPDTKQATGEAPRVDAAPSRKSMELAYVCQEMKNALNGIRFVHKLLETTAMSENQKQVLETSDACERQIMTIIDDMGLSSTDEGVDLNFDEFMLGSLLDVVVSQVMILLRERKLQMFHEIPEETTRLLLYGDQARLQLVLSDFLENIVRHASSPDGWVEIKVLPARKQIKDRSQQMRLQFRMAHSGEGLPSSLVQEMFEDVNQATTPEGLGLNLSRKLLGKMNGQVHYVREQTRCYFVIDLEMTSKFDGTRLTPADTSMIK